MTATVWSLTAVCGLIWVVTTVIFSVTLPPEWDAFVVFTNKLKEKKKNRWFFKISGSVMCDNVLIQADMLLPDWRCSWTSSVCRRLLGKSWWGKRTCNPLQERASTGYCSLHCLSGTGGLPLKRRDVLTRRTQSKSDRTTAQMEINMWLLMTGIFVLPSGWRYGWKMWMSMGLCKVLISIVLLVPRVLWALLMDFVSQSVQ